MPLFEDENDVSAIHTLHKLFPDRRIVTIKARDLLLGGGNLIALPNKCGYKSKF